MDITLKLLAIAVVMYLIWLVMTPKPAFAIRITSDGIRTQGKVPAAFLADVRAICADARLYHGTIKGIGTGKRTSLVISRDVPPNLRQRFRNVWNFPG
jgi:hypothetical protein